MKLTHIRVEQLRQFRQPLVVDNLHDGLNLFTGPNESGKSTLVRAIRAAFFERYKSSSVGDLQPWDDSGAAPEVTLEFQWQEQPWRLQKRFLKKQRCDLRVGSQAYEGEDAEDKLAELLGFQFSRKGASRAEHQGIPGLLWIEQGAGQDVQQVVRDAGDHLKSAMGSALGDVASTGGDELVARLEAQRSVLLTSTGRPTGEYKAALEKSQALESSLADTVRQIADYSEQVDRLAALRSQQQEDRDKPWLRYRAEALEAEKRLQKVEAWQLDQSREQQELAACRASQALCRSQLQVLAEQLHELEERRKACHRALAEQQRLREQGDAIHQRTEQARNAYAAAQARFRLAQQMAAVERLQRELDELDRQVADESRRLNQAKELTEQLRTQQEALGANVVDAAALKQLRDAVRKQQDLAIEARAAATRVEYRLQPGQTLALDGESLEGQGERLLLQAASLDIPGTGRLRILPGGQDLAELARKQERLKDRIEGLLNTLRVTSLEEAEARAETGQRLGNDIADGRKRLAILAPTGVDALSLSVATGTQRKAELQQQLQAQLPPPGDEVPGLAAAELELESADAKLKDAEREENELARKIALAEQTVHNTETERAKLERSVETPEYQQKKAALNKQLIELQARESVLEQGIAERAAQIEAANPDILRQDIERFTRTANEQERIANEREKEILALVSKLEVMGAQGLEDTRAEQELALEQCTRRCAEFSRRAAALDLLLNLLRDKRQVLTRRLHAPLQRRLNHYLKLLFPNAQLELDDDLVPLRLVRSGNSQEVGELDALSFGAREQMGLISRLAYADMLQEAGRPTLIILDDALVHSDPQRLAQMKRILFDAGTRHQILLFTCHPDNWRDLGVSARELGGMKQAQQG